jgi:hypothetical protein
MSMAPLTLPLMALLAGAPAVDALAWMAGTWQGRDADGTEMEEAWLAPRGGTLLGVHRDVAGGKTVSFEFLRIAVEPEGVVYWASPQGRPATPFKLAEAGPRRAVFANPAHDFPQRILYWIDEKGAMHARIEGDGPPGAMEWTWTRKTP